MVSYPDLGAPPQGWTVARFGAALRLVPPGAFADRARASIYVSPLVPVSAALPELGVLMRQALAAEMASTGLSVEGEPVLVDTAAISGLRGKRMSVAVRHPGARALQRRIYVMYRDEAWLYGVHYVADEETFDHFLSTFDTSAQSIRVMPPPPA